MRSKTAAHSCTEQSDKEGLILLVYDKVCTSIEHPARTDTDLSRSGSGVSGRAHTLMILSNRPLVGLWGLEASSRRARSDVLATRAVHLKISLRLRSTRLAVRLNMAELQAF